MEDDSLGPSDMMLASSNSRIQASAVPTTVSECEPVLIPTRIIILTLDSTAADAASSSTSSTEVSAKPTSLPTPPFTSIMQDSEGRRMAVIHLDSAEAQLLDILRQTMEEYNQNHPQQHPPLEIRVAGGWVRDKILQQHTHDVDVTVNAGLTGVQMAELVRAHLMHQHASSSSTTTTCSAVHRIAANPDQSKHLETATMRVAGIDVDFVPLRGDEIYDADSRIPTTTGTGTPYQDAHRRDFTCNALFYNIGTQQIEDHVHGRGWEDLQHGRLVTPLDPHVTLREDPLRVLRAIRFAVRYQFVLDNNLQRAATSHVIHKALHTKVSRERVGKELEGMLSGRGARPVTALRTMAQLALAGSVFAMPVPGVHCREIVGTLMNQVYTATPDHPDDAPVRHLRELAWQEGFALLQVLAQAVWPDAAVAVLCRDDDAKPATSGTVAAVDARLLPLAVFVSPFRYLSCYEKVKHGCPQPLTSNDKQFSVITYMFKEGVKFKIKDCQGMTTLMQLLDRTMELLQQVAHQFESVTRLQVGIWMREAKELWVTALRVATAVLTRQQQQQQQQSQSVDWMAVMHALTERIVQDWQLDRCWTMRPLLDGRALIDALNLPRGPQVGLYLEAQIRWMLAHPHGTVVECRAHLLEMHETSKRRRHSRSNSPRRSDDDSPVMGISDGIKPSSPLLSGRKVITDAQHFAKKMHVESMDTSST